MLFGLFLWVVPVLAAMIFVLADFYQVAIILGGISGFPSPFYALAFPIDDHRWWMQSIARTFPFTVAAYSILVVYLILRLKRSHREVVRRVEQGDAPPPASREISE